MDVADPARDRRERGVEERKRAGADVVIPGAEPQLARTGEAPGLEDARVRAPAAPQRDHRDGRTRVLGPHVCRAAIGARAVIPAPFVAGFAKAPLGVGGAAVSHSSCWRALAALAERWMCPSWRRRQACPLRASQRITRPVPSIARRLTRDRSRIRVLSASCTLRTASFGRTGSRRAHLDATSGAPGWMSQVKATPALGGPGHGLADLGVGAAAARV